MKCLDTTFLIDIVEEPEATGSVARELESRGELLATTVFNAYEALLGVQSIRDGRMRSKLLDQYAKALSRLVVLPLSLDDAVRAAELGGELRRKGRDVGADCITAAVALRNGCDAVVTRNADHFERIRELTGLAVIRY